MTNSQFQAYTRNIEVEAYSRMRGFLHHEIAQGGSRCERALIKRFGELYGNEFVQAALGFVARTGADDPKEIVGSFKRMPDGTGQDTGYTSACRILQEDCD